jgi:hypothetical protein
MRVSWPLVSARHTEKQAILSSNVPFDHCIFASGECDRGVIPAQGSLEASEGTKGYKRVP